MNNSTLYLLKDRRFFPLFLTQFCGCFNDCLLKSTMIIFFTYQFVSETESAQGLALATNALFVLPFIIFASIAGQISDKYERTFLVRIIKCIEIAVITLGAYGFYINNRAILLFSVALMGIHSTFFGPLKYSMLPDFLEKEELISANGYIEGATFISIALGSLLGGFYITNPNFVIITMISVSCIGFISSLFLKKCNNAKAKTIEYTLKAQFTNIMSYVCNKQQIFLAILGISWFWFIGAALLAQIPTLAKEVLGVDEGVANLFLAAFALGVGTGSFLCNKFLNNEITTKYTFMAAAGMGLVGVDLFFASKISAIHYYPETLKTISLFLKKSHNWRVIIDLFLLAAVGGFYVVPLYTSMQYYSASSCRSQVIAANNLINSIFMIASTTLLYILFYLGCSIPFMILIISLLTIIVAGYIYQLIPGSYVLPKSFLKAIVRKITNIFYRVEVRGLENFYKAGSRVVIISNHMSFLDSVLLALYIPHEITFAINTYYYNVWWMQPFLKISKAYPVDNTNALGIKYLIKLIKKNKIIAIFPEGRIGNTGTSTIMKVYDGAALIADKANANILPVRVNGTQYTHFVYKKFPKIKLFPKITIDILPAVILEAPKNLNHKERRNYLGNKLYELMVYMVHTTNNYQTTFYQSLINAKNLYGKNKIVLEDTKDNTLTYQKLIANSIILGHFIKINNNTQNNVGIMLPTSIPAISSFFGMQCYGLVPVMLNFTSGISNIVSSCKIACLEVVVTARQFIEQANLSNIIEELQKSFKIVYLEDLRYKINFWHKLKGVFFSFFPTCHYRITCNNFNPDSTSVILFTSGTEGKPKAVALSHLNILYNHSQMISKVDLNFTDIFFNSLPLFHSFGLSFSILSILGGSKLVVYPTPLHYTIIPEMIYGYNATVVAGTNTFLKKYAQYGHCYDFKSIRFVCAGAEKLQQDTYNLWLNKYGIKISECYGATEASPGIAINTFMENKIGSVGKILPGLNYKLLQVEGISEGGLLCISGPNIALGYIYHDNPEIVKIKHKDLGIGWYDTGDVVKIDEKGFITIVDRLKRFAKIAGEMISLSMIEEIVYAIDNKSNPIAIVVEDIDRGEKIVLYTTSKLITRESIISQLNIRQISELFLPKKIVELAEIPLTSSGKINYQKLLADTVQA